MEDEIFYEDAPQEERDESNVQIDSNLIAEIKKYAPGLSIEEAVNEYALPLWIELQKLHLTQSQAREIKKLSGDCSGPYKVEVWGDCWCVVDSGDPQQKPINGKRYKQKTHAHRAKRRLNQWWSDTEKIMENGAIII